jgi:hypothetical protein
VLALRGRVLPDAHPMVAAAQQVLGLALLDVGRAREAEPSLRESLALRRKSLPPGHWHISSSESALGACLTAEGRYAEANSSSSAHTAGSCHPAARTTSAPSRCASGSSLFYEAWGRPDRAAAGRASAR